MQSRIAWRTRTSLNGAMSTRIVIGFQPPVGESATLMPDWPLEQGHLRVRHLVDRVHLAREQRVHARGVVRQLHDDAAGRHRLVSRVVLEPAEHGLAARLEATNFHGPVLTGFFGS